MKHRTTNMNPDIRCRGGHRTSNVPDNVGARTALSAQFHSAQMPGRETDAQQVLAYCQCSGKESNAAFACSDNAEVGWMGTRTRLSALQSGSVSTLQHAVFGHAKAWTSYTSPKTRHLSFTSLGVPAINARQPETRSADFHVLPRRRACGQLTQCVFDLVTPYQPSKFP